VKAHKTKIVRALVIVFVASVATFSQKSDGQTERFFLDDHTVSFLKEPAGWVMDG
jgi:hypothetical protein